MVKSAPDEITKKYVAGYSSHGNMDALEQLHETLTIFMGYILSAATVS